MSKDSLESVGTEYEFFTEPQPDPTTQDLLTPGAGSVHLMRTSDRILFRRCRRKWGWIGQFRGFRAESYPPEHLWFGSGFHYALEDLHGPRHFASAYDALVAYTEAWKIYARSNRRASTVFPPNYPDLLELGKGMLDYYEFHWLSRRDWLKTHVVDGIQQCEVNFEIPLPFEYDGNPVIYRGTLDRVSEDEYGRLWVVEYKTAKSFRLSHFDTDDQITSYCWAASKIYPDREIAGVIYQQHKKSTVNKPRILASGKLSTAATQGTTHSLYREAIIKQYGKVEMAPSENVSFLNQLLLQEDVDGDAFIRRDIVERNIHQINSQEQKILLEAEDMCNPDLPLYPNPNKDCGFDCVLQPACIALDDGSDWEQILEAVTTSKSTEEYDSWRKHLLIPPK